ncbi:unnamed protein product [Urochloa humidicola]
MTKQKIVIKVSMSSEKSRSKAMALVARADGVSSMGVTGDGKDQLEVVGDGVDTVCLVQCLRRKIGHAARRDPQGGGGEAGREEARGEEAGGQEARAAAILVVPQLLLPPPAAAAVLVRRGCRWPDAVREGAAPFFMG